MRLLCLRLRVLTGRVGSTSERGVALVLALLAMGLVLAVSGGLVTLALIETRLSAMERERLAGRSIAEVQLERAFQDLALQSDWNAVVAGTARSAFFDGDERPRVSGWGTVDLAAITARLGAGGGSWGADRPRWRLYSHGWSRDLMDDGSVAFYSAAWVADDEVDGDGRPDADLNGVVQVRVEVFGTFGVRQIWIATVRRVGSGLELVSLRVPP